MAESHSLAVLAESTQERLGDHDALVFEGRTFRSAELAERSRRAAGGLADLGVAPGERVVVLMANCPEVLITYNAVWRAGAVVTPVVFVLTAAELRQILLDSGAVVVVTTGEIAHARTHLAPTKYPREIRLVDNVPLTSVGKLDRKALRQLVAAPP